MGLRLPQEAWPGEPTKGAWRRSPNPSLLLIVIFNAIIVAITLTTITGQCAGN